MYKILKYTGFLCLLTFVILVAACSNSNEETNMERSTADHSSMSDGNHISLEADEEQKRVDIYIGEELFTSYLYVDDYKKPILYPLMTANGSVVTRGFPIEPREGERDDHPHQVGLWLNYGDVNGLDFWNNSDARPVERRSEYGTIYHKSVDRLESGDEQG